MQKKMKKSFCLVSLLVLCSLQFFKKLYNVLFRVAVSVNSVLAYA